MKISKQKALVENDLSSMDIKSDEDVEGYDTSIPDSNLNYPIDSFLIRHETRTAYDVVRRVKSGTIIMDPDFQRDFIWEPAKQSKFIESLLMRLPLPVFYLAENNDGRTIVVDGLQRLMTIFRYINNVFALKGLKGFSTEFNNRKFEDLPPKYQNYIEDTQLILYLIDNKVPVQAQLDIFERVNSGERLTRQQMRNCIYIGKGTKWLKEMSNHDLFLKATSKSINSKTMRDRECINRYCGFKLLGIKEYNGDMDDFLAKTLLHMNTLDDGDLNILKDKFILSLKNNISVFGQHAFRKHDPQTQYRSIINISLFDVYSVILSNHSEQDVNNKKEEIRDSFYELIKDNDFHNSISLGTNGRKQVSIRFELVENEINRIFKR
jgi:hypothetical protein